jgi:ComF family protein
VKIVRTLADAAFAVLIGPTCAVCDTALDSTLNGPVCGLCWASVRALTEPLCAICGDARSWRSLDGSADRCARCRSRPRLISAGRAIGAYEGTLREIVHALKYANRRSLARHLARRMVRAGGGVLEGADLAVPVPLHFLRHYHRGFNQAAELSIHLGIRSVDALRRRRPTTTQTDLPETQRHANVRGAFLVRRSARTSVRGAVVVLVDDVSTTGATIDACAAVLMEAGAKDVRALTAARAVSRWP